MRENINVYKALIAETGVMRLPGRYRRIWQDNIKMDLKKIMRECGMEQFISG